MINEKMSVKDSVTFILNGKPVEFKDEKQETHPEQESSEETPKNTQDQQ